MNYKIAGKSVDTETQETLEKLNNHISSDIWDIIKDGEISSADEANALLNVVSDNVIDDADYDKINRGLSVNNHIYHDEFANLAKVFEEKFPRNGQGGFKGLSRFGIESPLSPTRVDVYVTGYGYVPDLERYGITTELYKTDTGNEHMVVKHGNKEIFNMETLGTETHFDGLKMEVVDSDLLYLFCPGIKEPVAKLQLYGVDFVPDLPKIPHEVTEMGFEFSHDMEHRVALCRTPLFNDEGKAVNWDPTVTGQQRKQLWALFDAVKYSEEPNGNRVVKFVSNEDSTTTIITIKPDGKTSVEEVYQGRDIISKYELQYKPPVKDDWGVIDNSVDFAPELPEIASKVTQSISNQDAQAYLDSGHSMDGVNARDCRIEDSNGNGSVDEGEMSLSQEARHPGPVKGMGFEKFMMEADLYKALVGVANAQGYTILSEDGLPRSGESLSMLHVQDPNGTVYQVAESDTSRYARMTGIGVPQPRAITPEELKTALEEGLNNYLDGDRSITAYVIRTSGSPF